MKYYRKILLWLLVISLSSVLLIGCSPASDEEPPTSEEDSQAQIELEALQAKYDDLSADYDDLQIELEAKQAAYDDLSADYDELSTQNGELSARYDELSARYDELKAKYDELAYEPETITEEEVEQALFELINQERLANNLDELEWDVDLHWWAKGHSNEMKAKRALEYFVSDQIWWHDVFRATSYGTADKIADAAMTLWKDNMHYQKTFLSEHGKYGAVAVSKSGEIFYITYLAAVEL